MSARTLATVALLAVSACAHARAAQLSGDDELYRLASVSLSGEGGFLARDRPLCLAIADGDPSPALLAEVRARIPAVLPKSQCPVTPALNADVHRDHPWLGLGRIRVDSSGVSSFGWGQRLGFGGTCTVQPPGTEYRVMCIGI